MILTIRSNDGWQEILFSERKKIKNADKIFLLIEITLSAKNWDKKDILNGTINDLVSDRILTYNQICIECTEWEYFLELTRKWEEEGILFEHAFSDELGDSLVIKLDDASKKLISSKDKPVLSFILSDSRSNLEFLMVIDRTSIFSETR